MTKQWTKDQKLVIIEYNKNHPSISTCTKFNISTSTLKRWKQEVIYLISRKQINEQNISKIVDDYVEFYNFIRPMKKLKKMSSIDIRLNSLLRFIFLSTFLDKIKIGLFLSFTELTVNQAIKAKS